MKAEGEGESIGGDVEALREALKASQADKARLEDEVRRLRTDLQRTEEIRSEELGQVEEKILFQAQLLDSVRESIIATDLDGNVVFWGKGAEALYGYSSKEAVGKSVALIVDAGDLSTEQDRINEVRRKGTWHGQYWQKRKDGSRFWADATISLVLDSAGRPKALVGIDRDISDAKAANDALRLSEERHRMVVENANEIILVAQEGMVKLANPKAESVIGYSMEELMSKPFLEFVHPADRDLVKARHEERMRGLSAPRVYEFRVIRRDETTVWLRINSVLFQWDYRPATLNFLSDVTEHRLAEERLRQSEQRLRTIFDRAAVGMVTTGEGFRILDANAAFRAFVGYRLSELRKMTVEDITHPEDRNRTKDVLDSFRRGQESAKFMEKRYIRRDGSIVWGAVSATLLTEGSHDPVYSVAVVQDITERKRAEDGLIRTQRLRAVAELSAGVSHNLNNLLCGILTPAQSIQVASHDSEFNEELEDIISSANRARDLVGRLHSFTQGAEERPVTGVYVSAIVEEAIRATRPRWKDQAESEGITITVETDLKDTRPVQGMESRFHEMVVNLLLNAVDALPNGGVIRVRSEDHDEGVRLIVADSGVGMSEGVRQRVFEPFFSTKSEVGVGLGLATVYAAVSQWGGTIDLKSSPGQGSEFVIALPYWEGEAIPVEVSKPKPPPSDDSGRLLIVEDDPVVRRILHHLLGGRHELSMFPDGPQGLAACGKGTFEVALIDQGLPGMAGDEVARQLKQIDSSIVTILITGWALERGDSRLEPFDFYLRKPFGNFDKVHAVVADALGLHRSLPGG